MENRVVAFLIASVLLLIGWMALVRYVGPHDVPSVAAPAPAAPSLAAPGSQPVPAAPSLAPAATARAPEERVDFTRPGLFHVVFSSHGAAPVQFTLLDPQYRVRVDERDLPIEMIKPQAGAPVFLTWFSSSAPDTERSDVDLARDAAWTVVGRTEDQVVYAADAGDLHLEKTWHVPRDGYALSLRLVAHNRGAKPLRTRLLVDVDGWHDPSVKPGGIWSLGRRVNLNRALCYVGGSLKQGSLDEVVKEPIRQDGDVRWVGYGEPFFLVAGAFHGPANRQCVLAGDPGGRLAVRTVFAEHTLAPGARAEFPMAAFLGPKLVRKLDEVKVPGAEPGAPPWAGPGEDAGANPGLGAAVDYTLQVLAKSMLWVLKQIQRVVVNWGVAIIVITVLLKLVLLYPTQQSMRSAKRTAKLKPEVDRIKEKWKNDKVRESQEQQALFKKHGVSMFGGCLPLLLQMPIYIAFYSMLSNAVELYRASFFGPISDMTEPYLPMSIATGALMFVQQLASPQAADPQQRQMMYMMPVMFMIFTALLPSGLTLYILTNTLLTMLHQLLMNRFDGDSAGRPGRSAPASKPTPAK